MSGYNWSVTSAWASIATGPLQVNAQAEGGVGVQYTTASSTPAASFVGIGLANGDVHPIDVYSGQNLYARVTPNLGATAGRIIAVDAST
jgi:hypothetical protein